MTCRMFAAAAVGLCLSAGAARAAVITSATYNGHTYYLLTASTWSDAQAEAVTLGGNLVTVNGAAENNFLYTTFGSYNGGDYSLWIGFNDAAVEGTFVWVSGESVAYTNWSPGEPSNGGGFGENYAYIIGPGGFGGTASLWNDVVNDPAAGFPGHVWNGVVEVNFIPSAVPEPMSAVLLGAGGLAVAARRRRA